MSRRPPRRGGAWMSCWLCNRAISTGRRLTSGQLVCLPCWASAQGDDGNDAA